VFGSFSVTEKNFNSSGLPSLLSKGFSALRGGGEYTQFTATIGAKTRSYDFSWTKPYFMDTQWTVGYEIESASTRYIADDYTFNTLGYTLRGSYQFNAFMKTVLHYRILHTKIDVYKHHIEEEAEEDLEEGKTKEAIKRIEGLEKIEDEIRNSGLISAIGAAWVYDSTNHPVKPSRGLKSRVESEFAGVGGKHTFFNLSYLNAYYWQFRTFDECGIWKLRADARFILPVGRTHADSIPLEERFFLGGAYLVRGYRPFRLGPQYEEGDPRGGTSLQYLSLEYMRSLHKRLEVFVFADSGHLALGTFQFGRMSTAVGLGVRIGLLPGAAPLVIGMGFPINPHGSSDVKRFFFELGGQF
jgi:outer membrane protein insertion porin family